MLVFLLILSVRLMSSLIWWKLKCASRRFLHSNAEELESNDKKPLRKDCVNSEFRSYRMLCWLQRSVLIQKWIKKLA